MRLRVGARTDVGLVREGNEDSYMVHEPLFAVADGMGGHQGGEVASDLAVRSLEGLAEGGGQQAADNLAEVVRRANREVLQAASQDPGLQGMGTTLTAAVALEGAIHLVHVGDSRAYLFRDGRLRQLTEDHTVVQRLVDEGRITREEAEIHPQRSILTRALGVDREITVDESTIKVRRGDRLLLCSDGLSGMVPEEEIQRILAEHDDPQAASDALVEAANSAGGQDNITAVVIEVLDDGGGTRGDTAVADRPPAQEHSAVAERPAPPVERPAAPRAGAPTERRRPWKLVLWILIPILVIGAALFGAKWWIDRQWFVGVSNDRVAVFRGIPAEPLGVHLASLVKETDIPAEPALDFPDYAGLDDGITASGEDDAYTIVEDIRSAVREAEREEQQKQPAAAMR
jgi:protein phosphatase